MLMLKKWSNKVNHTSIKSGNECLTTWLITIHFTFGRGGTHVYATGFGDGQAWTIRSHSVRFIPGGLN